MIVVDMNKGVDVLKSLKVILAVVTAATVAFAYAAAPAYAASEITKEETVYVVTDATGAEEEVIVSDHLKNDMEADTIDDATNLTEVENVKGDETFEKGKGEQIIWKAGGSDIFYEGVSNDETPVTMDITYKLDGAKVEGKELKDKKGNVEIEIKFENNAKSTVNGREVTVPFIAMTGFIASDDTFSEIEIDHGKVIDDGDKKIVVGMAAPGLADALDVDLDKYDIDLSDSIRITGTVNKFDVQDIMTVVTNSVFEDIDTDDMNIDFDDEIDALDDGAKALVDGSEQLYDGISTLNDSMPELEDGVEALDDGAVKLRGTLRSRMKKISKATGKLHDGTGTILSGLKSIKKGLDKGDNTPKNPGAINALDKVSKGLYGAVDQSKEGADRLSDAADKISSGADALDAGASDLASGSSVASDGASQLEAGASQISGIASQVVHTTGSDTQPVAFNNDINAQLGEALTQGIITEDTYIKLLTACGAAFSGADGMNSGANGLMDASLGMQEASEKMSSAAVTLHDTSDQLSEASSEMIDSSVKLKTAAGAVSKVNKGLKQMSTSLGYYNKKRAKAGKDQNTIIGGLTVIDSGLGTLNTEVARSVNKKGTLTRALNRLVNGTGDLRKGTEKLSGGVDKLEDGSSKLSDGMEKFYNEGIKELVSLYRDDIKGSVDNLRDTLDAGADYRTFTRLPKGMDGNVKFIYKTSIY